MLNGGLVSWRLLHSLYRRRAVRGVCGEVAEIDELSTRMEGDGFDRCG